MKPYLIVYQGGTCGNLMAGLIHTLQTNTAVEVRQDGSLHEQRHGPVHVYYPWKILIENDLNKNYNTALTNIFITHDRNIRDFASSNDLTVIKIVYTDDSKKLIRQLVSEKAQLTNLKQWYLSLPALPFKDVDLDNINDDTRVVKYLYRCLDDRIDNFMDAVTYYHHTVNFEDIWTDNENLLNQLSNITGLKSNEKTVQLIQNYVTINNRLYK
jgi:hypothetical protein